MNPPLLPCELKTTVLVIGAGPAGSSAALALRRAGVDVLLADRCEFPRGKVCGDALIPDSLAALDQLGLKSTVTSASKLLDSIRIYAPNGSHVTFNGEFACLPRSALDSILQSAAVSAGAAFLAGHRAAAPILCDGRICGARFERAADHAGVAVRADLTFLATGAAAGPLSAFGVRLRPKPSALAMRAYYRVPDNLARQLNCLCISYDRTICPGFGWVFPGPDNVCNMGVGLFCDTRTPPPANNLRELWSLFTQAFPPAGRIVREGHQVSPLKGAPLRTGLAGSRLHRPGLVVLGEAAGLTYPFSGEGIGKAMESGILAAQLAAGRFSAGRTNTEEVGHSYERTLRARYGERYRAYKIAQDWLSYPAVCNLVAARANTSERLRLQLEAMLTEKASPRAIFSALGLLRLLLR